MKIIEETGDIPKMPDIFPGHLLITFVCPECNFKWHGLTPIGDDQGATCPSCDFHSDMTFVPTERSAIGHDGAWLMGTWTFADMPDDEDEYDDPEYDIRLAPWWARLIAFFSVIREAASELFGRRQD